jgi:hypothetical protein
MITLQALESQNLIDKVKALLILPLPGPRISCPEEISLSAVADSPKIAPKFHSPGPPELTPEQADTSAANFRFLQRVCPSGGRCC